LSRFSRGELFSTAALSTPHFLGCGLVVPLPFSITQCVLEMAVIVNHDRLACRFNALLAFTDRLLRSVALPFAGRFRSLLSRCPLWKVQKQCHQSRRRSSTLGRFYSDFAVVTSPFWTGFRSLNLARSI
jgi:hypothetical protein